MSSARVWRNGPVWTNYVLSRDASLPRNGRLANSPGGEYHLFGVSPFQQISAVCWSGDGSLQASIPSSPAKSPERVGRDGHNKLLHRSSRANIPGSTWSLPCLLTSHSRVHEGLVSRSRCCKLSQDHKGGGMLLGTYAEMYY